MPSITTEVEVDIDLNDIDDDDLIDHLVRKPKLLAKARNRMLGNHEPNEKISDHLVLVEPHEVAEMFRSLDSISKVEALQRIKHECTFANIRMLSDQPHAQPLHHQRNSRLSIVTKSSQKRPVSLIQFHGNMSFNSCGIFGVADHHCIFTACIWSSGQP